MKKLFFIAMVLSFTLSILGKQAYGQEFVNVDNNAAIHSEYNNGFKWTYIPSDNYVVGMTIYVDKNDYGKFYQMALMVYNKTEESITFDPENITAVLTKKEKEKDLLVYSFKKFTKKMNSHNVALAIAYGFSSGVNIGSATANNPSMASALNMMNTATIMNMGRSMNLSVKANQQGYWQITTVHPDESLVGYMNIDFKRGEILVVRVPVAGEVFTFTWDLKK